MVADCIFCKIIAGQAPAQKVYETEAVLAFRDLHPAAPTHILIVPKQHIPRLADLTPEDAALLGQMMLATVAVARQENIADGFRVVVNSGSQAGQSVFHIHLHLLGGRRMSWPPG